MQDVASPFSFSFKVCKAVRRSIDKKAAGELATFKSKFVFLVLT